MAWVLFFFHLCPQEHWISICTVNVLVFTNTTLGWCGHKLTVVIKRAFHSQEIIFTHPQKWCHYQANQWQLPETLWLLDRLESCSMHQSLFKEITSASAIRNTSPRKRERKERKKKLLWLQRFEIKRHHTEDDGEFPAGTKAPTKCDRKKSHCVTSLLRILYWHAHTQKTRTQQLDIISLNTAGSSSKMNLNCCSSCTKWRSPSVRFRILPHRGL